MSATILIVDDEDHFRENTREYLQSRGYETFEAATLAEARETIHRGNADIVLLDVMLPDGPGTQLLEELTQQPEAPPIILITAHGKIDMAVSAMKAGAQDFLQKPVDFQELEQIIERANNLVTMRRELDHYRRSQRGSLDFVIGNTRVMKSIVDKAQRTAETNTDVLITGETGTGKEVLARAIHSMGPRKDKLFVDINCPGMPRDMFESELFGHEAGAFTDAKKKKIGLMQTADEGILFLDEISLMPPDTQGKLLRALQTREFRRVGGNQNIRVDVQVIAATNQDLRDRIREGQFREDLFYRLHIIHLHLPPLRERKEDIPELVGTFLRELGPRKGKNVQNVHPRAMDALMAYHWPGNIRELRHAIEHALLFCDGDTIEIGHLPAEVGQVPA